MLANYTMPRKIENYLRLANALMHFVQAKTLLPEGNLTHCKLGFFLFLMVGLYFPLSLTLLPTIIDLLPQIAHCFSINLFDLRAGYQEGIFGKLPRMTAEFPTEKFCLVLARSSLRDTMAARCECHSRHLPYLLDNNSATALRLF